MSIAISGSIAFDTIMVFEGRFREHILPDQVHMLNVAFLVPGMRREYGGCAANIAFNLKSLETPCSILATIGDDGVAYRDRLSGHGIDTGHVKVIENTFTAQAFITTDLDDNQITAFHPGAMTYADRVDVPTSATLGIVAPNGKAAMLQHAQQFHRQGTRFIFDPGQGLPMFNGEELRALIAQASWVSVNDYEGQLLSEKTGWSSEEIAEHVEAYIVTRGAEGSTIYTLGHATLIAPVKITEPVDPTGCGDAYRAGLLFGLMHSEDWRVIGQLGSVMGALKVTCRGAQNHHVNREGVRALYEQSFGIPPKFL